MKLIVERVTCRECGGDGYVPHENEEGCGACRGDWGCRKYKPCPTCDGRGVRFNEYRKRQDRLFA